MTSQISTFLYKNVIELSTQEGQRSNLPMYQNNSRVFKGVDNKIDFTLKNADRKPIKILGGSIKMFVFDNVTDEVLLEKYAIIIDEIKGKYQVIIESGEVGCIDPGVYRFSVVYLDFDGFEQMLYTDYTQGSTGVLEIVDDSTPKHIPATHIREKDFKIENNYKVTGRHPGDAQRLFKDGLHTAFFYFTRFTGTIWIQGSLEEMPSAYSDYFDITTLDLTSFSGIKSFNFVGNYPWIRFKYQPLVHVNVGFLDKVWYKH